MQMLNFLHYCPDQRSQSIQGNKLTVATDKCKEALVILQIDLAGLFGNWVEVEEKLFVRMSPKRVTHTHIRRKTF